MADGFEELMRDQEHYFSGALWAEASQGCRGSGWGLAGAASASRCCAIQMPRAERSIGSCAFAWKVRSLKLYRQGQESCMPKQAS